MNEKREKVHGQLFFESHLLSLSQHTGERTADSSAFGRIESERLALTTEKIKSFTSPKRLVFTSHSFTVSSVEIKSKKEIQSVETYL